MAAAEAGVAMTVYAVMTIVSGVIYGFLQKTFKHFTLCISLAGVGISMFMLYFSNSFLMVCASMLLSGIASVGVIPACFNEIHGSVPFKRSFVAAGLGACGVNAGAFFTTPYLVLFENAGRSVVDAVAVSAVIMIVFGFVTIYFCKKADQAKEARLKLEGSQNQ